MFDNILVVCVGNICRSPTAENLLRQHLQNAGKTSKTVKSAGLATESSKLAGNDMDDTAREVAQEQGVSCNIHSATQLNSQLVKWADLILVMEQGHKQELGFRYPAASGKTMLYGQWLSGNKEIPDPYRKSKEAFEHVYKQLEKATQTWIEKL